MPANGVLPAGGAGQTVLSTTLVERARRDGPVTTVVVDRSFDGFDRASGFQVRRASGQFQAEIYGDAGIVGLSRWAGGTGVLGTDRGPTQGDHYVWGTPATALPTGGLFNYNILAFTQPTLRNVATTSAGSVTGHAAIRFDTTGSPLLGLNLNVLVNGVTYAVSSPGGLSSPSLLMNTASTFNFAGPAGGPLCTSSCQFAYASLLAGTGGSHIGLTYTINPGSGQTTGWVDGGVIFGNPARPAQTGGSYSQTFNNAVINAALTQPQANPGLSDGFVRLETGESARATTLGASNPALTRFNANSGSGSYAVDIGTMTNANAGGVANAVGWTRWSGGTTSINGVSRTLTANQGLHLMWIEDLSGVTPTGRANYLLAGGTQPTLASGASAPGTFRGALVVDFATSRVGWDSVIDIAGDSFNFISSGGTTTPSVILLPDSSNLRRFDGVGSVFAQSGLCGGCEGSVVGFIGGPDANGAGFSYTLQTHLGGITGVAGFRREVIAPTTGAPLTAPLNLAFTNGNSMERVVTTATLAGLGTGAIDSFTYGGSTGQRTTATNVDFGGAGGQIGWTRWASGTVNQGTNRNYNANTGLHVLWGTPVSDMPTSGSATYSLVGSTRPTISSGVVAPGTFTGSLGVNFATMRVGWSSNIVFGSDTYVFNSAGGAAAPSVTLGADGRFTGGSAPGGVDGSATGFLAGPGASHAGFTYQILVPNQGNTYIAGAAAFRRD